MSPFNYLLLGFVLLVLLGFDYLDLRAIEIPDEPDHGRVRRFKLGDCVDVVRGGFTQECSLVLERVCDPAPVPHFLGSSRGPGNCRYRISGYDGWVYDWMLELHKYPPQTQSAYSSLHS